MWCARKLHLPRTRRASRGEALKRRLMAVTGIAAALTASVAAAEPSMTERQANLRMGEAIGRYIGAAGLAQAFRETRCGYVFKKRYATPEERVAEVTALLRPAEQLQLRRFVASRDYLDLMTEYKTLWAEMLSIGSREFDINTVCGMLATSLGIHLDTTEKRWEQYLKDRRSE